MPRTQPRWAFSFEDSAKLRDAGREADAGDPCTREARCAGRRVVIEGGERTIVPARASGPFCPSCTTLIGGCLPQLPPAWARLAAETPQMHRRGAGGHAAFGPRLPFDAAYDELTRRISETLLSWEERVRRVAHLLILDTQASRSLRAERVAASAQVLGMFLSALLALPPEPMMRSVPHAGLPDDVTMLELGGQQAGEEILDLHRRALLLLGELVRQREPVPGVPCRSCEAFALFRAEPPSDPSREAMYTECADCRAQMSRADFGAWAAWYARWADGMGWACRRCGLGAHGECEYARCACAGDGHPVAAVAA